MQIYVKCIERLFVKKDFFIVMLISNCLKIKEYYDKNL